MAPINPTPGNWWGLLKAAFKMALDEGLEFRLVSRFVSEFQLSRADAGRLYSQTIAAVKAGEKLRGLRARDVLDPSLIPIDPYLFGSFPGDRRFEYHIYYQMPAGYRGPADGFVSVEWSKNLSRQQIQNMARQQLRDKIKVTPPLSDEEFDTMAVTLTIVGAFRRS